MVNYRYRGISAIAVLASAITGLSLVSANDDRLIVRWYTEQQSEQGRLLYLKHCVACHGQQAKATAEWRRTGADGNYPPPPLNGTAHTWHHPLPVLERSISEGGVPNGGVMPGFAAVLDKKEMRATIAYFQSFWPDDIYARWREIDERQ